MTQPQIYGLIGYPVKHSLSPAMHNAAFRALKINAEYKLFEVKPEELGGFIKSLPRENICGLNVTVPHKEKIIPFLCGLSEGARLIGAVNTIKVADDGLKGFNTDGEGFLKHLTEDLKFNPQGKNIAILGAGGASRAIAVYLTRKKPGRITIYDIDKDKLISLSGHLKKCFYNLDTEFSQADSIAALKIRECDLLVNATPSGMKEADPALLDEKFIHRGLLVYDLIYNPPETKLLKIAKGRGAQVSNGLGMLLYQGAAAFELWTGQRAPVEVMRQALKRKEGV